MSSRYLKAPNPPTTQATDELRARVAEMLRDIEAGGIDAVRRYSRELDGWDPDVVRRLRRGVRARRRRSSTTTLQASHIAFAQDQVRGFAQAQRGTLTDLEVEMGPGRRARPSPHPGQRRRRLRARAAATRCSRRRS